MQRLGHNGCTTSSGSSIAVSVQCKKKMSETLEWQTYEVGGVMMMMMMDRQRGGRGMVLFWSDKEDEGGD